MVDIDIGDYEIDQDSNDDLVIKDPNDNQVMKWDKSAGEWNFGSEALANIGAIANAGDITDSGNSTTVYDSSAQKVGDGNQNADINDLLVSDVQADSVSAGSATIGSATAVTGGPVGDSGDLIPLATYAFGNSGTESTTSQGRSNAVGVFTDPEDKVTVDYSQLEAITNIGDIHAQIVANLKVADSSAEANIRARDSPNDNTLYVSTSSTSFRAVASDTKNFGTNLTSPSRVFGQIYTTDSNHAATVGNAFYNLYGEIQ